MTTLADHPHQPVSVIEAGLAHVRAAPDASGRVERIVRRPSPGEREVVEVGELSEVEGLIGDDWQLRPSRKGADGGPHPDMQVTLVSARFVALVAPDPAHALLMGDQLHVDLDLSEANLPAGTRVRVGTAILEITAEPHTGCAKYLRRFGAAAMRIVASDEGRALRLRGVNARVVEGGTVRQGDPVVRC